MEGFQVPIHQALTKPLLIAGAPRELALLNGTLGAALTLGMHSLWGIPVSFVLHLLSVSATKNDPQFFETFRRQLKQKAYYGE